MSLPSPSRFRSLLRGLSSGDFARFVADLWAARGWSVEVGDSVVVASRDEPARESQVLVVRHTAPWLFRPDWVTEREDATHVVTSGPATARARTFADERDAKLIDAADLYGMVRHAVGEATRDDLFRTHFGRPADSFGGRFDLDPSSAVAALADAVPVRTLVAAGTTTTVLVVGAVVALAVVGAVVAPLLPGSVEGSTAAPDFEATATPASPTPATSEADTRIGVGEGAWPMFGGGPDHAGRNDGTTGPAGGAIAISSFETGGRVVSSPAVVNGTVYFGSNDERVYALDAGTLAERWSREVGENVTDDVGGTVWSSPAVVDGTVYFGSYGSLDHGTDHGTFALSAATGEVRWRARTGRISVSSPAVVGGTVYIASTSGTVYALFAANGTVRWRAETAGAVHSSPAVVDGTVFVGSGDDRVYALSAATGEVRWRVRTGDDVVSSPAVANGTVYVGSADGSLYALSTETGEVRWTVEIGGGVTSSPAVANGTVFVGSTAGDLYAVGADSGEVRWTAETEGGVVSSPAVANGTVYFGSTDGRLHAVDAADGTTRFAAEVGGSITSSPAVADGVVFVGSTDGRLYVLRPRRLVV